MIRLKWFYMSAKKIAVDVQHAMLFVREGQSV